ncbi:MAG TPA: cytochrome c oxidase subunit 4 [Candidatus Limnocylindrales bacterium]|nr:cytochrome c oxidase subunit 4 [Candidatus Limnocylindrales bacterium]
MTEPGRGAEKRDDGATQVAGGVSSEVKLFGRMAIFGLAVGTIYWFLTYDEAGTVMLLGFGGAAMVATVTIFLGSRNRRRVERPAADGPIGATLEGAAEPLPEPGWAPLGVALGLGGVGLAGAFGAWLAIAGLIVALRSAKAWLDATIDETDRARGRGPARATDEAD